VEVIVNVPIPDRELFSSLSVGEGIPYTSYCLETENKNSAFRPYMGIYVSGTPVRGGARTPYFTMRSQASFTRALRCCRNIAHFLLPFVINTCRIIWWIYKCTFHGLYQDLGSVIQGEIGI